MVLAYILGQLFILIYGTPPIVGGDSPGYLAFAHRIQQLHGFTDPSRTLGYPLFLAVIFDITGGTHLAAVVVVQAVLMGAAAVELYVLTYRVANSKWLATFIGVFAAVNVLVLQWEVYILTEALAYWLLITLVLLAERVLTRPSVPNHIALALTTVGLILVRPTFLPVLFILAILIPYKRRTFIAISVLPLTLVVVANGVTQNYWGLSNIVNSNLLHKEIEFKIPVNEPQFATVNAVIQSLGPKDSYLLAPFCSRLPTYCVPGEDSRLLDSFLAHVVLDHPLTFAVDYARDVGSVWLTQPRLQLKRNSKAAPVANAEDYVNSLASLLFPVLLVALLLPRGRSRSGFRRLLLVIATVISTTFLAAAGGDYMDYSRDRVEVDNLLLVATLIGLLYIVRAVTNRTIRPLSHG
jgi:hypothetical protein